MTSGETMFPRYTLAPAQLSGDVLGWQLHRDGRFLDCHETFLDAFDRDLEAAMDWADQVTGARQDWRHTRAGGPDRWTAVHSPQEDDGPTSADADLMRSIQPGTLLVAVGAAGSGKSTFAAAAADVATVVCLDALREEISGDAGDQSATPAAVERQNLLLEQHLAAGTSVFLDSTNVEPGVRAQLVERARRHGCPIVALRFLPHLDTCRARNAARPANRQVPDDVLVWQHTLALAATPKALLAEGFTAAHDIVTPL
ncbi:AAA family ATPase [Streptomyces sp. NPDC055955]|uniref:AAA family ATPase n=1 Tax=Streptomyces sp. NPDC055955 TaxID=3345665 RepID=UPI0035D7CE07